jgi:TonB family protein
MSLGQRISVSFLMLVFFPFCALSQGPIAPNHAPEEPAGTFQNSPDGLRLQLQVIFDVARQRDASRLESLIKQMEIPDATDWFARAYGNERAESFAESYRRDLPRNEMNFQAILQQPANDAGDVATRKVNDAPAPGMEERMLDGLQGGTEVFFASWKKLGASPDFRGRPVGYFVFVDGSFRLIRAFDLMSTRPMIGSGAAVPRGNWSPPPDGAPGNVPASGPTNGPSNGAVQPAVRIASWPKCDFCPDPEYCKAARKKRLEGSVVLQVTVQPDGSATDLQVIKSPDPELSQMAIDGVSSWRFSPALSTGGEAVPYKLPIEVTFRLLK